MEDIKNKKNQVKIRKHLTKEERLGLFKKLRTKISDEERKEITEKLFIEYKGLVSFILKKMNLNTLRYSSIEDVFTWGCRGLLDAIKKYDPDYEVNNVKAKFMTFAYPCIRNSILSSINRERKKTNQETSIDIEKLQNNESDRPSTFNDLLYEGYTEGVVPEFSPFVERELGRNERDFIFDTMNKLLEDKILTKTEYRVIMTKYNNDEKKVYSNRKVAEIMECSPEWVGLKHKSALSKLKKAIIKSDEYYKELYGNKNQEQNKVKGKENHKGQDK